MSKHFKQEEFACRCGCGRNNIDPGLVAILDRLREAVAQPLVVTSGCRCEAHNAAVGGAHESPHTKGLAVDISAPGGCLKFLIVATALALGITRFGLGKNFVHIDIDNDRVQRVIWTY